MTVAIRDDWPRGFDSFPCRRWARAARCPASARWVLTRLFSTGDISTPVVHLSPSQRESVNSLVSQRLSHPICSLCLFLISFLRVCTAPKFPGMSYEYFGRDPESKQSPLSSIPSTNLGCSDLLFRRVLFASAALPSSSHFQPSYRLKGMAQLWRSPLLSQRTNYTGRR